MSLGTQLHRASLKESYDSIVIGSGVGGLSAAVCLAKAGQKVLVLERHYTAGGFSHTYQRKGYEWDVGLHYVGDVHRPASSLRRMFDYVSDGQLKWQEMDPVYDKIILGKETFDYQKGEIGFREQMHRYFPNEKSAIETYISLIKKVNRAASPFFYEKALPQWIPTPIRKYLKKEFLEISQKSTREVLEGLTQNQKLIAVLSGQWGDYGLPPEESSFAMHALVAKHYLSGASYPIKGSSSLARTMLDALRACGGDVITNAEVTSILLEKNKAIGIQLRNGQKILARHIISAAGVLNTYQRLLPEGTLEKFGISQGTHQLRPSFSHLCLCLGIKGSQKELRLGTSNLWIYKNEWHEENIKAYMDKPNLDFPVVYISFPSAKDPEWDQSYPDKSTVEIVVPAPYHWFEKWNETKWMKRGQEYNEFKKAITERLIETLLEHKPELKDRIQVAELSTPLSTVHFSHYSKGEIYGVDHTSQRFRQDWIRTDSPIKNLYLTGQDIVTCGIAGALSSGFLTASRILGPIQSLPFLKHMLGSFQPKVFRKKDLYEKSRG